MNKQLLIAVPAFFCGANAVAFLWQLVDGKSALFCVGSAAAAAFCGVMTLVIADTLRNVR